MIMIKPNLIGELQDPVKSLHRASDLMVAFTNLMNMLEEYGIDGGEVVFEFSLTIIEDSWKRLFKLLKALVWATTSLSSLGPTNKFPASVSSHSGFESAKASASSDIGSDNSTKPHFDPDRPRVIVVYANKWVISTALTQERKGVFWPVIFTSRSLKTNELNYQIVEKEVLTLLRVLDVCHTVLVSRSIKIVRCTKDEDEVLGTLTARITPREEVGETLVALAPKKRPRQVNAAPTPTVKLAEELIVVSFNGSARVKRGGETYIAIVWKLPEWTILTASSVYPTEMTVNEAEYHGLSLCLDLLAELDRGRLAICGDFNLMIRQMRGEIACKAPVLQLLRKKTMRGTLVVEVCQQRVSVQ
ncbi:reverse transcriptase [Phytophthora megakarya]|uniref:Reverse transcriptase n=1 Tax=Phytophthora megakarya TaxID=4795 RepID=A0A225VPB4_9STRA|nr:reverse transcriptase [Phytophthora megakarya]